MQVGPSRVPEAMNEEGKFPQSQSRREVAVIIKAVSQSSAF